MEKEALLTFNPYQLAIELNMSNDVAYLRKYLDTSGEYIFFYMAVTIFYPQEGTGFTVSFFPI